VEAALAASLMLLFLHLIFICVDVKAALAKERGQLVKVVPS
jgi:hypothetical protein